MSDRLRRVNVILSIPDTLPQFEGGLWKREDFARLPDTSQFVPPEFEFVPNDLELGFDFHSDQLKSFRRGSQVRRLRAGTIAVPPGEPIPVQLGDALAFEDPVISSMAVCPADGMSLGTIDTIRQRLAVNRLHEAGLDGRNTHLVVVDEGVNLSNLQRRLGYSVSIDAARSFRISNRAEAPFNSTRKHGTMVAHTLLQMAPKATLIDVPMLTEPLFGNSVAQARASNAIAAYNRLLALFRCEDSPECSTNGVVVNNSWGVFKISEDVFERPGHGYLDNPSHPLAGVVSAMVSQGMDVVFAAGNCGRYCPSPHCQTGDGGVSIWGAAAYEDVVTVGAVEGLSPVPGHLGYSSSGPAIDGLFSEKPDLVAYSHFWGSGEYLYDGGTSTAAPIVSGLIGALRSRHSAGSVSPRAMRKALMATADASMATPGQWHPDFGYGLVDANRANAHLSP